jgi:hypothetical protein
MEIVRVDGNEEFKVDSLPEECPRCHKSIAVLVRNCGIQIGYEDILQVVFRCPACKFLFFGTYQNRNLVFKLQFLEPVYPVAKEFGPVDALSPRFVAIFNQAAAAEAFRLTEIAGMAYRKSLEFLIKDYCILRSPNDAEAIKKEFLGVVIRDRLTDRKIQMAAQKATWLGNDEAHYVREWIDHDVEDLKNLIRITVSGISEELEFDAYMQTFAAKPATKKP